METKDRELLLKDLCARLPYGVQCQGFYVEDANYDEPYHHKNKIVGCVEGVEHIGYDDGEIYLTVDGYPCELGDVKPFLRPMESMTEEEAKTFVTLWGIEDFISLDVTKEYIGVVSDDGFSSTVTTEIWYDGDMPISCYDFLNAHHLDYRGLIPMGLALPAPDGMYNL